MKFLNKQIDINEVNYLLEEEIFDYWIDPRNIVDFNKVDFKNNAELKFFERRNNIDFERDLESDEIITEYLIGCLSKDAFTNQEQGVIFLNYKNVIDAAVYMINELGSSTICYNYTTFSRYLINENNVNEVLEMVYKYFEEQSDLHLKNIWRIFDIELIAYNLDELNERSKIIYTKIKEFKTDNTYMY